MSGKVANNIITNGLVFYADVSNSRSYVSGSTKLNDISKNGTVGTLTNNPTFNSGSGGSLVFNGTNQYIKGVDSKGLLNVGASGNVTVEAFIYSTGNTNYFFTYGFPTVGTSVSYGVGVSNTGTILTRTGTSPQQSGGSIPSNQWTSVTVSFGTGGYKYINGSPISGNGAATATPDTTGNWNIGALSTLGGTYFTGRIACVRVYNRVLSAAEVLQNYNALKGKFGL
jgi:hypothetical protein